MSKISILELPIKLFQPMEDGDPYIALIGTDTKPLPILIRGKTPLQAQMKAEEWRKTEHARVNGKTKKKAEGETA